MKKLTNYEQFVVSKLRNPTFKKTLAEESLRLKVAYRILELRRGHELTQKELAKKIGTSQSVVARIEHGQENISVDRLDMIAHVFGKHVELRLISV